MVRMYDEDITGCATKHIASAAIRFPVKIFMYARAADVNVVSVAELLRTDFKTGEKHEQRNKQSNTDRKLWARS